MKSIGLKVVAAAWFLGMAASASAARLVLGPESGLWLQGDSTLHVFHSTATELRGSGEMDVAQPFPAGAIRDFEFAVAVKALKSGKAGLDQNMRKALKAEEHPEIVFRLAQLAAEPDPAGGFRLQAEGTLSISGRERPVTLKARARAQDGTFHVEGEQKLLMSDFGVKPPVMMLGAIKTRDEVVIRYSIFLHLEESHKEAGQ